uniref:Uncharacterized protein n=1 Tax=Anguilla anguilla TaxID=7936 RepID=A0A0E9RNB3_ANGAN
MVCCLISLSPSPSLPPLPFSLSVLAGPHSHSGGEAMEMSSAVSDHL